MSRIRSHLSYANVMATIAVFVALGGTSYAVTQLPRNSVGAKQIRTGAVGQSEIRKSAVRSKHVKNRSIALQDISLAARASLRGQQGPAGLLDLSARRTANRDLRSRREKRRLYRPFSGSERHVRRPRRQFTACMASASTPT